MDLCSLAFGGVLGCFSATAFLPFCRCGPCLRGSSWFCEPWTVAHAILWISTVAESSSAPWVARVWVCWTAEGGTTSCGCWLACENECGGVRSRDLDLSSLLERTLFSADRGGPASDEEVITVKSSSDISSSGSGKRIGWIFGSCGTCTWGGSRSRDLDRSPFFSLLVLADHHHLRDH